MHVRYIARFIALCAVNDGVVDSRHERNVSAALNWYLNQYLRVSANVVKALDVEGCSMDGDEPILFQMRLQLAY